ncbi:unnamed protein product [Phaedon cochleariae]|uniref:Transcriptional repressor p66 coiled-coil MBD2-interaction domain-containing protein n=1 Tax=Phaedon cochleariae TaxID=80249 RepID=A0A9N9SFG2_PHACE|nr:unnamed protein product [Phaedon cochleariae]
MEVDEAVVDLSISSNRPLSIPPAYNLPQQPNNANIVPHPVILAQQQQPIVNQRRILRPRTEPRSYVESPDVLINGTLEKRTNGNLDYSSDSSEGEMPPLAPIKELSSSEIKHRDRGLRRLREELRAEEMKLVLLKKLKQSQQLKENVAVLPASLPASALAPPKGQQSPQMAHARHPTAVSAHKMGSGMGGVLQGNANSPNIMRQQAPPARGNVHGPPLSASPINTRTSISVPQPPQRTSIGRPTSGFSVGVKDLSPSVTITPAPPQTIKERPREDNQTPAQRQAAAKLALRKQLEKTLLQIPPPKPPPPEMHFIPNPSNTEFIYLVGLEHVVDFLTKETKIPLPPQPFACSQCQSDFTPVWKWETGKKQKSLKSVICEQCVTNNVKKALKAEHTNRLKTAFVKALQQEQEIEQRLAQNGVFTSSSPAPSPVATPEALPKAATPTPAPRPAPTPPAQPPPQPTPPPPLPPTSAQQQSTRGSGSHGGSSSHGGAGGHVSSGSLGGHGGSGGHGSVGGSSGVSSGGHSTSSSTSVAAQDKYSQQQNAAAMQALQQQLLRSLSSGVPPAAAAAHMLQFSPLLYPYQLAMAQAQAAAATGGKSGPASNLAELQRAADLHRQYLLDMIPPAPPQRHNWKA